MTLKRHDVTGELAHASVPDVKEAEGGLRDAGVLKAIEASWLVDASTPALEAARQMLLDVRDEVQDLAGRPADRIAPEMWGPLAERLGLADAEAAQRHVRSLGRRIAHLSRLAWRRTDAVMARSTGERGRRTPALERIAPGIALSRGEVVLDAGTRPGDDPTLLLRAAAEAASRDVVLAPDHRRPPGAGGRRAARAVAGPRPRRARPPARQRARPAAGLGDPRRGRRASRPSCPSGSRSGCCRTPRRSTASPSTGTSWRPAPRPAPSSAASAGPTCCWSPRCCTTSARARCTTTRSPASPWPARSWPGWASPTSTPRWWPPSCAGTSCSRTSRPPATPTTRRPPPSCSPTSPTRPASSCCARSPRPTPGPPRRRPGRRGGRRWSTASCSRAGHALGAEITPVAPAETLPVPDVVRRDPAAVAVEIAPHEVGATVTVVAADRVGLLADVAGGLAALRVPVHAARAWSQVDARRRVGRQRVGGARRLPRRERRARPDPPRRRGHPAAARPVRRARTASCRRSSRSARTPRAPRWCWRSVPPTAPAWSTAC